ncbi:putative zinc ribbon protein [Citrobacter koseri]|uniref:DUF7828 domain-containing protein n=1 Tax=Citrobacter TaxID=544 RepID=UPI0018982C6D|nr:hypothetical protein [Citrobacter koseri]MBJ9245474.1 hypothetical protein [Citrobacter koseri]HCT3157488.1 hypothetical protein [Citrobacter koseri]
MSYGCALILHAGSSQEPAKFEHDQCTVARRQLMDCVYLDPGVKADEKRRSLAVTGSISCYAQFVGKDT